MSKKFFVLFLWALVIALGMSIGLVIGQWLEHDDMYAPLFLLIGFSISGMLIGFGQWLLLPELSRKWILATALGVTFGLPIGFLVNEAFLFILPESPYWAYFIIMSFIAGAITGTLQKKIAGKGLLPAKWILISAFSYLGLAFFFPYIDNPIYSFETNYLVLYLLLYGILYGLFAGIISGSFIFPLLSTDFVKARALEWRSISFIMLILLGSFVSKLFLYDTSYSSPFFFSSYDVTGYYDINPETLFDATGQVKSETIIPSSEEIWNREEPYYDDVSWTEEDYIKIVDIISRDIWKEPFDQNEWKVLSISLQQSCDSDLQGFYDFDIVYYRDAGVEFWHRRYETRLVEIYSWQGIIRWGEGYFSNAVLPGWGNTNLKNFNLTAEDALQIADTNGGGNARKDVDNNCYISVRSDRFSPLKNKKWEVGYWMAGYRMRIDPFSGKFKVVSQ